MKAKNERRVQHGHGDCEVWQYVGKRIDNAAVELQKARKAKVDLKSIRHALLSIAESQMANAVVEHNRMGMEHEMVKAAVDDDDDDDDDGGTSPGEGPVPEGYA